MELTISHITKQYGSMTALQDVSFTLSNGIYALLGANGSGKSTLLRIIVDLLQAESGEVLYNQTPIHEQKQAYLSTLGYMPQNIQMYPTFRVEEFLTYMGTLKGLEQGYLKQRSALLLQELHLAEVKKKRIKTLSGGMRQRLGLAQSLLNDPNVLILDEPSVGLDPKERNSFKNHLARLGNDRIILLSTHIVEDIEHLCKEILILKQGQLIWKGQESALLKEVAPLLYETYINRTQLLELRNQYRILSCNLIQPDEYHVRYLSEDASDDRQPQPTLQDAYLRYFQELIDNDETCPV